MYLKCVLVLVMVLTWNVESAKILAIFQFHSKSHHILGSALAKALASKGHEVTMISPFPLTTPVKNYEDIHLTGIMEYAAKHREKLFDIQGKSVIQTMSQLTAHIGTVNEMVLNHTAVQNLLNSGRSFDLVIQNWFYNHAFLGIANHLNAPVIAFSTLSTMAASSLVTQNPNPYSYVPYLLSGFPSEMTFFERVGNTFFHLFYETMEHLVIYPQQSHLLNKYFPKAPPLETLLSNISLFLLNSHFSIENPRPYVPNMVQVGGFHVEDGKTLEGDLKQFMDSAKEGVVFFSLGSNLKITDLTKDQLEAIVQTFRKLPLKVLWKFESEDVPKLPSNVKVGKWLPQRDILAHKNTKIFVTHGGMLSTTEAIYNGVPFIGIPFFSDQHYNVADGASNGYAVKLPLNELTEETFTKAIGEILNNPRYYENIKIRSLALRDQPLKPMDNAIYWIEYVLRHKGAAHLKTAATKLRWYQYYLLDVIAFLGVAVLTGAFIVYKLAKGFFKIVLSLCKNNTKKKKKTTKKTKKTKSD